MRRVSRRSLLCASAVFLLQIKDNALSTIAWWKSPSAEGEITRERTLNAPPDSPAIVTLLGSPPNASIFSRTHSKALIRSRVPKFPLLSSGEPVFVTAGCKNQPIAPSR